MSLTAVAEKEVSGKRGLQQALFPDTSLFSSHPSGVLLRSTQVNLIGIVAHSARSEAFFLINERLVKDVAVVFG